jgi:hypothetical protein
MHRIVCVPAFRKTLPQTLRGRRDRAHEAPFPPFLVGSMIWVLLKEPSGSRYPPFGIESADVPAS